MQSPASGGQPGPATWAAKTGTRPLGHHLSETEAQQRKKGPKKQKVELEQSRCVPWCPCDALQTHLGDHRTTPTLGLPLLSGPLVHTSQMGTPPPPLALEKLKKRKKSRRCKVQAWYHIRTAYSKKVKLKKQSEI